MIFTLIDITGTILDIMIALSFFSVVLQKKNIVEKNKVTVILGAILFSCMTVINVESTMILTISTFATYFIVSNLYKSNVIKRLLLCVLLNVFFILSEIVMGLILSALSTMTVEQLTNNVFFYMQGALMSKILVFVIVKAVGYFSAPLEVRTTNIFYIILLVHPLATFLIIYVMSEYMYFSDVNNFVVLSAVAVIILIMSNVLLFYLFEHYHKMSDEKTKQKLIEKDLQYKAEYYRELSNRQKITNKAMHDLKNQLFALKESLENNADEGMKKINKLCDDILLSKPREYTRNEAVDALISVKSQQMNDAGIPFKEYIYTASDIKVDTFDMCILLGNLLDNAVEASMKVEEEKRLVELNMKQSENYLIVQITNTVNELVLVHGNEIVTTKDKKELHGYGLKSVNEIVRKYNGNCVYRQEGDRFMAILRIKNY